MTCIPLAPYQKMQNQVAFWNEHHLELTVEDSLLAHFCLFRSHATFSLSQSPSDSFIEGYSGCPLRLLQVIHTKTSPLDTIPNQIVCRTFVGFLLYNKLFAGLWD